LNVQEKAQIQFLVMPEGDSNISKMYSGFGESVAQNPKREV